MMSDITLCLNVTKKNITYGLYLHITKELHGNHIHDCRDKRPCLSVKHHFLKK